MILWVVECKARARTWSSVTADLRDDSRKSAQKPNPPTIVALLEV